MPEDVLFCWSGGKDSAMALHALRAADGYRITALLTTVTEEYDRISMHGVRRVLLERQAESLGLPLHAVLIPPQCINATYETRMKEALVEHLAQGVQQVAFGDIFLEDLRVYREKNLAQVGMQALFPIWKRDTRELAREFVRLGFRAIAVCVDPRVLDPSSRDASLTNRSSPICRRASIPAARTANSTHSFLTALFFGRQFISRSAKG